MHPDPCSNFSLERIGEDRPEGEAMLRRKGILLEKVQ